MPAKRFLHCSNCAGIRPTEVPPCADGHGPDCPDRACTECGTALLVDPLLTGERRRPGARRVA